MHGFYQYLILMGFFLMIPITRDDIIPFLAKVCKAIAEFYNNRIRWNDWLVREYVDVPQHSQRIIIIRNRGYYYSVGMAMRVYLTALLDFFVSPGALKIVRYGGIRYKYTFGVEFTVKMKKRPPKGYFKIRNLEYTA